MSKETDDLIARVKALPPMTKQELEDQAIDFAYGNLSMTTNHKPTRKAFNYMCLGSGWSQERFDKWADGKEWKP